MRESDQLHSEIPGGHGGPWVDLTPEQLQPRVLLAYHYVLLAPYTPGVRVPGISLNLVVDGEMWFRNATGKTGVARRGELVCFYSGLCGYAVGEVCPLNKYTVHLLPDSGQTLNGIPALPGFGRLPEHLRVGEHLEALIAVYERLLQAMSELRPTWQLESGSAALQLLQLLFDVVSAGRVPEPRSSDRWENLALRLRQEPNPPAVSELADHFNLSTRQFIRVFTQRFGTTPKQYMLQQRLWRARRLLQRGEMVKTAAIEAGFQNPLYFSRLYRQRFGYPPSETPSMDSGLMPPDRAQANPSSMRLLFAPGVGVSDFTF